MDSTKGSSCATHDAFAQGLIELRSVMLSFMDSWSFAACDALLACLHGLAIREALVRESIELRGSRGCRAKARPASRFVMLSFKESHSFATCDALVGLHDS